MSERRLDLAKDSPTAIARQVVGRGERLLWADRAVSTGPRGGSPMIAGFGLVFTAFALLWTGLAWTFSRGAEGLWSYFYLFGLPFLIIGLGITTAPFWVGRLGGPTVYALTDRRVVVIHGRGGRMVRSADLTRIGDLHWSERRDGIGDIMFDGNAGADMARESLLLVKGMFGVPNVRRVARDVERARDGALRATAPPEAQG